MEWVTNAPAHWPRIQANDFPTAGIGWRDSQNFCFFLAALGRAGMGDNWQINVLKSKLLQDGVLDIPLVIIEGEISTSVFLYDANDPTAADHFRAVSRILVELGEPAPVYYCPGHLQSGAEADVFQNFHPRHLSFSSRAPTPGHYAMWWGDRALEQLPAAIGEAYKALDRIETGFVGYLIGCLKQEADDAMTGQRIALPDETEEMEVVGPEDRKFLISFSVEKGIRLHFHMQNTPLSYRNLMWFHFAEFAKKFRAGWDENDVPLDPIIQNARPLQWWHVIQSPIPPIFSRDEATTVTTAVGTISVEAPTPDSFTNTTGGNEPEQSSPSEWQYSALEKLPSRAQEWLICAPMAVFYFVASADGEVDGSEQGAFLAAISSKLFASSAFMTAIVGRLQPRISELSRKFEDRDLDPVFVLQEVNKVLAMPAVQHESVTFTQALYEIAEAVACASGGFLGLVGSKISPQEAKAIRTITEILPHGIG